MRELLLHLEARAAIRKHEEDAARIKMVEGAAESFDAAYDSQPVHRVVMRDDSGQPGQVDTFNLVNALDENDTHSDDDDNPLDVPSDMKKKTAGRPKLSTQRLPIAAGRVEKQDEKKLFQGVAKTCAVAARLDPLLTCPVCSCLLVRLPACLAVFMVVGGVKQHIASLMVQVACKLEVCKCALLFVLTVSLLFLF